MEWNPKKQRYDGKCEEEQNNASRENRGGIHSNKLISHAPGKMWIK